MMIGFAGLGVMGGPMCRNLMQRSGAEMQVFDPDAAALQRLVSDGASAAVSVGDMAAAADVLFLSLPGGAQLEQVVRGPGGLLERGRAGLTVVDTTTSPVALTRELGAELEAKGIAYADAPVARTRQAAAEGTLSITVGASDAVFASIRPLLAHMASDVTHCGPIGCGQVVKILNNAVLFQTVVALAEAMAMGEAAGVARRPLFEALAKGSADSFALRNHGMKAMVPDDFPASAFPTDYALKDIGYALDLARQAGIDAPGATLAEARLRAAREAGFGDRYFPVLARVVDRR